MVKEAEEAEGAEGAGGEVFWLGCKNYGQSSGFDIKPNCLPRLCPVLLPPSYRKQ